MSLFADIAHGNVDTADVLFLVAFVVFVVAVIVRVMVRPVPVAEVLVTAGLALLALAWLLL